MTKCPPQVTCIGLANVDVIASVDQTFIEEQHIAPGASTILDSCQTGNLLSKLDNPQFHPGGCAANTACGLSLFGVKTRFIGKTGDDIYADIFRKGFAGHDIIFDTPAHAMKMTSTCLTLVTPDKNRSFAICTDTAGWYVGESDLPALAEDGSQSIYLEANAARIPPNATQGTLLQKAVEKYAGRAINIFINLNDWEIVASARDILRHLLEKDVTFFIGNIQEIMTLFEVASAEEALSCAVASGKNFAITDGPSGAYIITKGSPPRHVPAAQLHSSRIVNTLGAGDQFSAGFIAGYVNNMDVMDSCLNGICAATEILQKRDARPDPKHFKLTLKKTAAA